MEELVAINHSVIEVKRKHAEDKNRVMTYIISQPSSTSTISFLEIGGHDLKQLQNEISDSIEKLSLIANVINNLRPRFPDCHFPDYKPLGTELETALNFLVDIEKCGHPTVQTKLVNLLKTGITVPIMMNIIQYVKHFHETMIKFIIKYVLIIPNELCVSFLIDNIPPRKESIRELYISIYNHPQDEMFDQIKDFGKRILPFFEKKYDQSMIMNISSNQKAVSKMIAISDVNEECKFILNLFKGKSITVEGFFYDYLLLNPNSGNVNVLFEMMARLLNMKIDNIIRRIYTLTVDPLSNTISMGSRICNYDTIPELDVKKISIMFVSYFSNSEKVFIRRTNIGNLLGKERSFEFKNHRHGDSYCMLLDSNRFCYDDTNNKIQLEKGWRLLGSTICPSDPPRNLDMNAAMVVFEDESNMMHGFFPTYRCSTYGDFVYDTIRSDRNCYNDDMQSGFIGCDKFNGDIRSIKNVFEGRIVSRTGVVHGAAKLMVDYGLFISNTKKLNLVINCLSISTVGMM